MATAGFRPFRRKPERTTRSAVRFSFPLHRLTFRPFQAAADAERGRPIRFPLPDRPLVGGRRLISSPPAVKIKTREYCTQRRSKGVGKPGRTTGYLVGCLCRVVNGFVLFGPLADEARGSSCSDSGVD